MNQYFEQWEALKEEVEKLYSNVPPYGTKRYWEHPDVKAYSNASMKMHEKRRELVKQYSWAIPDDNAIDTLVSLSPLIEIGAGTGYWANLIHQFGGDIIAFDKNPPHMGSNEYKHDRTYYSVQEGSFDKLKLFPNRTLFICWPPYGDSFAYDCVINYTGDKFVYIGESGNGCTADNNFFHLVSMGDTLWDAEDETIKPQWINTDIIDIPNWDGIHDSMYIFERIK